MPYYLHLGLMRPQRVFDSVSLPLIVLKNIEVRGIEAIVVLRVVLLVVEESMVALELLFHRTRDGVRAAMEARASKAMATRFKLELSLHY